MANMKLDNTLLNSTLDVLHTIGLWTLLDSTYKYLNLSFDCDHKTLIVANLVDT